MRPHDHSDNGPQNPDPSESPFAAMAERFQTSESAKQLGPWLITEIRDTDHSPIALTEQTEFRGPAIDHLYRVAKGFQTSSCPKCSSSLQQKFVNLVYSASGKQYRQNVSCCAFICEPCSVAVIDEALPKLSTQEQGIIYHLPLGVLAMSTAETPFDPTRLPRFFPKTYEGHEPVFVIDENEQIVDVDYKDEITLVSHELGDDHDHLCPCCIDQMERILFGAATGGVKLPDRQKQKNKKKQQKASRKANRRRRR